MIDAVRAMAIADAEARDRGWGGIDAGQYEAKPFVDDGRSVWCIGRKRIVIGHQLWFMIDAETEEVLESRYRGPR